MQLRGKSNPKGPGLQESELKWICLRRNADIRGLREESGERRTKEARPEGTEGLADVAWGLTGTRIFTTEF